MTTNTDLPSSQVAIKYKELWQVEQLATKRQSMLNFAYGSNMSIARLRKRVPSAQYVAVGTLTKHKLAFHKVSQDGSGKCDAQYTGSSEDNIIGVVFDISDAEKPKLDRAEGLNAGYDEKQVEVVTSEGQPLRVQIYFATNIDSPLKPYNWYKKHVLVGAKENGLPLDYITQVEAIESEVDPDQERCERELTLYS